MASGPTIAPSNAWTALKDWALSARIGSSFGARKSPWTTISSGDGAAESALAGGTGGGGSVDGEAMAPLGDITGGLAIAPGAGGAGED